MSSERKFWSEDDIRLLKAMSQYFSARVIAERLSRSETAVRFKLRSLKIKLLDRGRVAAPKKTDWSDKEIAILKKYAGSKTSIELEKTLPARSSKAIRMKASQLGLTLFKSPWSDKELSILLERRMQGVPFKTISAELSRSEAVCRAKHAYLTKLD